MPNVSEIWNATIAANRADGTLATEKQGVIRLDTGWRPSLRSLFRKSLSAESDALRPLWEFRQMWSNRQRGGDARLDGRENIFCVPRPRVS